MQSRNTFPALTSEDVRHDWAVLRHAQRSADLASQRAKDARPSTAEGDSGSFSAAIPPIAGGGRACEAGPESAEGAGLVTYKTRPNEQDSLSVKLDKRSCNIRRIKRLKRSVWASGYFHNMARPGHRPDVPWFVTLTYAGVSDWRPDHIGRSMDAFRRWCRRKGVPARYTWVAELQQRGAVHYHLIVWLPRGVRMPMWDKTTTSRGRTVAPFWPHGMTNRQPAQSGIAYLMKYLSKLGEFHEFPRGCRTHGVGGLDDHARLIRSWYNLPEWVKRSYGVAEIDRFEGRLVEIATGRFLEPMYRRQFGKDELLLIPLRPLPDRWHDGPYSTWKPEGNSL